jgi:uncharacterized lipoprotein YddW (UPF0748 family)
MPTHPTAAVAALTGVALSGLFSLSAARAANPADPPSPVSTTDTAAPAAFTEGTGEIRALWVVRDSMTSPQKIRNTIAMAKKYGFNTLFVQVRGRGDAYYHSNIEPRAEDLAHQPADFDPLGLAISEGHKAGLEVHAWMCTFFVWHKARHPYSSQHVVNQHPEWLVQDKNGNIRITPGHDIEGAFLDPALPEVRAYTRDVFLDLVKNYAVDGIHFDYVRFPSCDYSFSRASLAAFRDYLIPKLSENDIAYADAKAANNRLAWYYLFPREWMEWRQSLVTETVRDIAEEAHQIHPGIIVSAAVFPNYRVASVDKGQAWHDWLREGILDAACPMTYNRSTPVFGAQVKDAIANSYGKPIIAGVGAWQIPVWSAIAKGQVSRQLGAGGVNLFSYNDVTRDGRTERYLAHVRNYLFTSRSAPPNWRRGTLARPTTGAPTIARETPKPGDDASRIR